MKYIIVQQPKQRYRQAFSSLVMVIDAPSSAQAARQFKELTEADSHDFSAPRVRPLAENELVYA
jgi:hypothetical protein